MATEPQPHSKDEWVFAFAMELVRLRRAIPYDRAESTAKAEWQTRGRTDPKVAARRWLGQQRGDGAT